ncbi:MAG: AMP-binding protein, partial [Bacteroidetes bacterium]|nr:AMP-binding protein [Bacteroidota bacterium]
MSVTRIFDILDHQKSTHALQTALACKKNGQWVHYSTNDFIEQASQVSRGLLAAGLQPGDKIANVSNNRPEWNILDMGMLQAGMVHVPLYPTITDDDYRYILKHAEVRMVFVSNRELYARIAQIAGEIPEILGVFTYDEVDGAPHWSQIP